MKFKINDLQIEFELESEEMALIVTYLRAIYMGELRKNTTSIGTITKKTWILLQV